MAFACLERENLLSLSDVLDPTPPCNCASGQSLLTWSIAALTQYSKQCFMELIDKRTGGSRAFYASSPAPHLTVGPETKEVSGHKQHTGPVRVRYFLRHSDLKFVF